MRRKVLGCVAAAIAALALLPGCGDTHYEGICQDARTHLRAEDDACTRGYPGYGWVYYGNGDTVPPLGGSTAGAPSSPGSRSYDNGGAPAEGGTAPGAA